MLTRPRHRPARGQHLRAAGLPAPGRPARHPRRSADGAVHAETPFLVVRIMRDGTHGPLRHRPLRGHHGGRGRGPALPRARSWSATAAASTRCSRFPSSPRARERTHAHAAPRPDAGPPARHRAPRAEPADGPHGRGGRLSRRLPGRGRHRVSEGGPRGESQPHRDVPGRPRHRRGLAPAAHPGRGLRLRRPDAHAPHHRHERGGRLRGRSRSRTSSCRSARTTTSASST